MTSTQRSQRRTGDRAKTRGALALAPDLPIRTAIYCRISLDKNGDTQGVDRQEQTCREIAEREGWEVAEVFIDNDISAYSGKRRPAYDALLNAVQRGEIDAVIAYHSDRLYRRPRDLERLVDVIESNHVRVLTAMSGAVDLSTASGRMVAKMLAVVSEHESARIGERVSSKHKANANSGRAHGGRRPFGYQRVAAGVFEIDPDEATLVREAAARVLKGASLGSIAVDWTARGIVTTQGGMWRPNQVSRMLKSGRYAGLREVGHEVVGPANWEPILPREQWERVAARITHAPQGRRPKRSLIAGMVVCDVCGKPMKPGVHYRDKRHLEQDARGYGCSKSEWNGCGSNTVRAIRAEAVVVDYVLDCLAHVNLTQARAKSHVRQSADLVGSIAEDEQMLDDLAGDLGRRDISRSQWLAAKGPIDDRLKENRAALTQLAADSELDDIDMDTIDRDAWEELTLEQKRAVIRVFVARVVIRKGAIGRTFDSNRVQVIPR